MASNRRSFIKYASLAAAGNAAALRPFGALNALAAGTTDYKALVCVFLFGGNDANNTFIPFDTAGYTNYSTIRGPLAIAQNQLLQLRRCPTSRSIPTCPRSRRSSIATHAAIVANVGTLMEPTTKAQYQAGTAAAHQSLLPSRSAAGVAERLAERRDAYRLGRPHRRSAQTPHTTPARRFP